MITVELQSLIESDLRVTDENGDELMGAERRDFLAMIASRINSHDGLMASATKWRELMEYIKGDDIPCGCAICKRVFALAKAGGA